MVFTKVVNLASLVRKNIVFNISPLFFGQPSLFIVYYFDNNNTIISIHIWLYFGENLVSS